MSQPAATATSRAYVLVGADDIDVSGAARITVTEAGGTPCRRCLQDAVPGEQVHLVSYDPFGVDSPYRGASPVYVHADPCPPLPGFRRPRPAATAAALGAQLRRGRHDA